MDTATSPRVADTDEREIRDLVARAQEAQNDSAALLELHTPGVVIVNLAGRRVMGREAFGEAMRAALASSLRDVLTTVDVVDIRLAAPEVAVVSCTKTVQDGRSAADGSASLPSAGALTYVMTKVSGAWRIAVAQTTPIVAAPAPD